jgi:hypothetical protein
MNRPPAFQAPSPRFEREATRHVARALGMPFVDLGAYPISCGILRRLPAELCCRLRCIPIVDNPLRTVLAIDAPWSAAYLAINSQWLGPPYRRVLEFVLTTPGALDAALHRRLTLVRD